MRAYEHSLDETTDTYQRITRGRTILTAKEGIVQCRYRNQDGEAVLKHNSTVATPQHEIQIKEIPTNICWVCSGKISRRKTEKRSNSIRSGARFWRGGGNDPDSVMKLLKTLR